MGQLNPGLKALQQQLMSTLGSVPEPANRTAPANSVALNPSGVGGAAFMAKGGEVLDANARKHIATKNFALPKQHKYPIHDIEHARNALARVSQFGTPEEKEIVRRQVHKKYPSLAKPYAEGGEVDNGSSYDKIMNFLQGGRVPGRGHTASGVNSYSNDTQPAMLSPGECVVPRSVMQSSDPVGNAAKFIAEVLAKKAKK